MKATQILSQVKFRDAGPTGDPLYVDRNGRVILFALKPGQTIKGHEVPDSPFYVVVLQGHGFFAGSDGEERPAGPNDLLIFDQGEVHTVRAGADDLVFLGFLHGVPSNTSEKVGGEIAHARA